jgi:hypothetical protein
MFFQPSVTSPPWDPVLEHLLLHPPLGTLCWSTLCLYSSLNLRDQVPHPFKRTGKIIQYLHIFDIYIFA